MKKKPHSCAGCNHSITKSQYSLRCNREYQCWFHKKFTELTSKEYEIFEDKKSGRNWLCSKCSHSSSSSETEDNEDESDPNVVEDERLP